MGFTDSALEKPLIAIVNTYTNTTPGHYNINEMCDQVKKGIESSGGTAMVFGSIAPCDGIAEGHDGIILPSRDLITSSVECMVRAHKFDGLVLLGSCAMLGTANTMGCLAEAMGMSLPGSGTVPAIYSKRMQIAYTTGEVIVDLVVKKITARQVITKDSICNAMAVLMGIGGSTNAIMHLQAIHKEAELGELTLTLFDELSRKIPQIASVYPASPYDMVD